MAALQQGPNAAGLAPAAASADFRGNSPRSWRGSRR